MPNSEESSVAGGWLLNAPDRGKWLLGCRITNMNGEKPWRFRE